MRSLPFCWLSFAALVACTTGPHYTGDVMGTFDFATQLPLDGGAWILDGYVSCPNLSELPSTNFSFEATFSQVQTTGMAFETAGGVERSAVFDGQFITSTFTASRQFNDPTDGGIPGCFCGPTADAGMMLEETLDVALLSQQQVAELNSNCPDAGVPPTDAGPRFTSGGFDALLACGNLTDVIQAPPGCVCAAVDGGPCTMTFPVRGVRH